MADSAEWYLPDPHGGEATGPYTTEILLEKMKQGALRLDDFAWGPHLPGNEWRRLHELAEFQGLLSRAPLAPVPRRRSRGSSTQRHVTLRFNQEGEYGIENRYRRFPRAPLTAAIPTLRLTVPVILPFITAG